MSIHNKILISGIDKISLKKDLDSINYLKRRGYFQESTFSSMKRKLHKKIKTAIKNKPEPPK